MIKTSLYYESPENISKILEHISVEHVRILFGREGDELIHWLTSDPYWLFELNLNEYHMQQSQMYSANEIVKADESLEKAFKVFRAGREMIHVVDMIYLEREEVKLVLDSMSHDDLFRSFIIFPHEVLRYIKGQIPNEVKVRIASHMSKGSVVPLAAIKESEEKLLKKMIEVRGKKNK